MANQHRALGRWPLAIGSWQPKRPGLSFCLAFLAGVGAAIPAQTLRSPVPTEPIPALVAALQAHAVVGLSVGGPHDVARADDLVLSLLRDSGFLATANDLIVEATSARFQDVMDRYVNGLPVADEEIRGVWDETTQQQIPGPIWRGRVPAMYRAVRDVNATRPPERRLRILLGDPPIDWAAVETAADFQTWLAQRDSFPADLLQREVIARGRRAVVLFNSGHLQRKNQLSNYEMTDPLAQTVVSLIEAAGTPTFVVRTAGDSRTPGQGFGIEGWPVPSLALIRSTSLGALDEPSPPGSRMMVRDGRLAPVPREAWRSISLESQIDAVLSLGPPVPSPAPEASAICADKAYARIRLQRMRLVRLPPAIVDGFRALCSL